jgi:phosphoglycerol transferase MdoB-like AlkP superfamily enzyme
MKCDDYWYENQDEVYRDFKVEDIIFPQYMEDQNGEVTVWNVNDK